jgi:methyl-accepting chemotaxis protein
MYEKINSIPPHFIGILLLIFLVLFTGCQSTKKYDGSTFIEHQERVDELKGRIEELTREIDRTSSRIGDITENSSARLDDIRRRSSEITDTIDRVIYLFSEYESEVQRLLSELEGIRSEIRSSD